jgi:hypothetical protein
MEPVRVPHSSDMPDEVFHDHLRLRHPAIRSRNRHDESHRLAPSGLFDHAHAERRRMEDPAGAGAYSGRAPSEARPGVITPTPRAG